MESTLLSVGSSVLSFSSPCRCVGSSRFGSGFLSRGLVSLGLPRIRLQFAARSAASYSDGAGGGGSGDGAAEGGDAQPKAGAVDGSALSSEVIILDVRGMTCGGCVASVKRILESQTQVSTASVNLTTGTAAVWPVSEAKLAPNWKKDVGEALAKHLSTCGFESSLRGQEAIDGDIQL